MTGATRSALALFGALLLIAYLPLPVALKLAGFVAATFWFNGLRRGGKTLLIGSPLLVALIALAYFPVSQRAVGTFVIAYLVGLFIVGIVGYSKLTGSVWRFVMETRAQLRAANPEGVPSQPFLGADGSPQKRPWAERITRRILGVQ